MTFMPRVSAVLPTYNERGNIGGLIVSILEHSPPATEVIVVDDDSPDSTWRIVEEMAQRDDRVRLLRRVGRRGLTSAIAEGISLARGDMVLWMDCDFSHPPAKIPELLAVLQGGAHMAVASRYRPGAADDRGSFWLVASSRLINSLARLILDRRITDYTSGYVAAKKEIFQEIDLRGDYGEYCIDLLYRTIRRGFIVAEVPYRNVSRLVGQSKTAPHLGQFVRRGLMYLAKVTELKIASFRRSKKENAVPTAMRGPGEESCA
ncbi:MAG: glycosyltransferase [Chloroflexi bacterium]|nr:glycosyltransferase [Chloroflexota bacterium]